MIKIELKELDTGQNGEPNGVGIAGKFHMNVFFHGTG